MEIKDFITIKDLKKTGKLPFEEKRAKRKSKFVIQKHITSRLHYDFRLELDGVLKSWAIPKGPSVNPSVKRLAMMVDDHPYEYKDFEGIISEGNYGAGEVIIWDKGTYHSLQSDKREESDKYIREGLAKGDLEFVLHGKKIKGIFALVRLKNVAKGKGWLLIKKLDEYASVEEIIQKENPVDLQLEFEEIKSNIKKKKSKKNI